MTRYANIGSNHGHESTSCQLTVQMHPAHRTADCGLTASLARLYPRRAAGRDHDHRHPGGADHRGGGRGAARPCARREIKAEINQIDTGVMEYKNKITAFPPNCQTDDEHAAPHADRRAQILNDLKRHLKQAFPRHQESDDLIRVLGRLRPGQLERLPRSARTAACRPAKRSCSGWAASAPIRSIRSPAKAGRRIRIQTSGQRRKPHARSDRKPQVGLSVRSHPAWAARRQDGYFDDDRRTFHRVQRSRLTASAADAPHQFLAVRAAKVGAAVPVFRYVAASGRRAGRYQPRQSFDPPAATDRSPFALHVHAFKKASDSAGTRRAHPVRQSGQVPNPALRRSTTRGVRTRSSGCQRTTSSPMDPSRLSAVPRRPVHRRGRRHDRQLHDRNERSRTRSSEKQVKSQESESRDGQKFDVVGSRSRVSALDSRLSALDAFPPRRHARRAA